MLNSYDYASRNKRELSVVKTFNAEILVCDIGSKNHTIENDGYIVNRRTNKLSRYSMIRKFQILYNWFVKEPKYLRKQYAYCISCHDLTALFIGWLSTWFIPKGKKPLLVYDSHEFEIGRNTDGKRNKLSKIFIAKLERFLMSKCEFSIMVNDSIADEVQKIHNLKERPIVVRNIPNYWNIDESVCKKRRQEFCEQLGIPTDTFIVMYHGGVISGRGIETLLKSIQISKNVVIVVLGNGEKSYLEQLEHLAEELQISGRVLFHNAVHIDDLWQYVGAADVGVTLAPNSCVNHYYMLPNKLFENIQSLTPIIGSDFPEIRKIIADYDIGLLVNPENAYEIADAIEDMRTNKEMYTRFKTNLKRAKEELCWENESKVLAEAYERIFG